MKISQLPSKIQHTAKTIREMDHEKKIQFAFFEVIVFFKDILAHPGHPNVQNPKQASRRNCIATTLSTTILRRELTILLLNSSSEPQNHPPIFHT
jgi:hypothetical protein